MTKKFMAISLEKVDLNDEESRKKAAQGIFDQIQAFVKANKAEEAAKQANQGENTESNDT